MNDIVQFPRAVRAVPDPLSLYIRAGRHGGMAISELLASGIRAFSGVVIDSPAPLNNTRQKEFISVLQSNRLDIVLDTQAIRLAMPGGYSDSLGRLPWGGPRMHTRRTIDVAAMCASIAEYAISYGFTEIIAPTHYLESAADPWFDIDRDLANRLRRELDSTGGRDVPIIYPLAIPNAVLRDTKQLGEIVARLRHVAIDMVWLRISGFGNDSTPSATRAYLDGAYAFHSLNTPVIADNVGGVIGKSLLAFGAVSGLTHGITLGERFDASAWKREPSGTGGFALQPRVYFPTIDLCLPAPSAEQFLSSTKAKAHFGCVDPKCCHRGIRDMIESPARHFLFQRMGEIAGLSAIPENLRPKRFIDDLRACSDNALVATQLDIRDERLCARIGKQRMRLDALRIALMAQEKTQPPMSFSLVAPQRAAREARPNN